MDLMTVSNRAKSSCEILEIATLVAHFKFDTGLFLKDSGPNGLDATTQLTSSVPSGRFSQGITFNGSSCYFQMGGFTSLAISNNPFSISLWLRPISLQGIVLHVSASSTGFGYAWCLSFLGFDVNGSFLAQIYNGSADVSVVDPTFSVSTSVWSHVVQTWSTTNGLRLYVNNVLVASRLNSAMTFSSSFSPMFLTLGNALGGTGNCDPNIPNQVPYRGDMDDFRVYSRELSASDVCALYRS